MESIEVKGLELTYRNNVYVFHEYEIIDERANAQIDFFEENGWQLLVMKDDDEDDTIHVVMHDENKILVWLAFKEGYYIQDGEHREYSYNKVK